jgi:hypothetical protein
MPLQNIHVIELFDVWGIDFMGPPNKIDEVSAINDIQLQHQAVQIYITNHK